MAWLLRLGAGSSPLAAQAEGADGNAAARPGVIAPMDMLRALIGPDNGEANAAQLCARAVILFFFGMLCIRIAGRRTFAHASPLDIVVALVIGGNLSRAMTGKAVFWPALAATLLLVVLHRIFAQATVRWSWVARLFKAEPVVLVRDGARDRKAMQRHGVAEVDLLETLRQEGLEQADKVHLATLENNGKISVVRQNR
jgi:uncharacterized membrane protein YcaP (DUF421 family)